MAIVAGNLLKNGDRPDENRPFPWAVDQLEPEQLRCPCCAYILVGLPGTRCPECGNEFDWQAVVTQARLGYRLPIERLRGWRRLIGAAQTWLLVLFRPWVFARFSTGSSVWPATVFAVACMAIGLLGNALALDPLERQKQVGWIVGVWFHVECQSLVFWLLDLRFSGFLTGLTAGRHTLWQWFVGWVRQSVSEWSSWRKVSLYTTGFVVLDLAGPPAVDGWLHGGDFPWLLRPDSWYGLTLSDILRGITYYWWMAVLVIVLWIRLRRKWCLLIILPLMPLITTASLLVARVAVVLIWYPDLVW